MPLQAGCLSKLAIQQAGEMVDASFDFSVAVDAGAGDLAQAVDAALQSQPVGVFMAQGYLGRTTFSCDDGKTWVGNRSWDVEGDPIMCSMVQNGVCDTGMGASMCSYTISGSCQQRSCGNDTPDVPKGVVYGNGEFVATWGWGTDGDVRRSTNGLDWTPTYPTSNFGGVAFGANHFVAASRSPIWSSDGANWTVSAADFRDPMNALIWSVRRFAYVDYAGGGRFIAVADGGTGNDILISSDGGQTWARPTSPASGCGAGGVASYGDILYGNGVIAIVDAGGNSCRSTDGGTTWTIAPTGVTQLISRGVWTGSEFRLWGEGVMISSSDGATWTQTALPGGEWIEGPVVLSPVTGTYVAIANEWSGYAGQHFLRSTDGITWTSLADGAFVGSHPIMYMTFGYVDSSALCPAP